jgi:hypothetical protein
MADTNKIDPQVLADLKAKHGEDSVHPLTTTDGKYTIVVRRPGRAQWKRFRHMIADPAKRADALETLVRDCMLYPDRQAFEAMLEERPALAEVFGDEVGELAGSGLEVEKNA